METDPSPAPRGNVAHYARDAEEYEYTPSPESELGQI